jgi:glyoxylase-like metal-dependent hydrolase (beta-lactamase superfamily II)
VSGRRISTTFCPLMFTWTQMRSYGLLVPVSNQRVHALENDETIDLGAKTTLRAIWTPSHAPHHLSYLLEESGQVFTGDAVGAHYSDFPTLIPTTPPPSFNLDLAIARFRRFLLRSFSRPTSALFMRPQRGSVTISKSSSF